MLRLTRAELLRSRHVSQKKCARSSCKFVRLPIVLMKPRNHDWQRKGCSMTYALNWTSRAVRIPMLIVALSALGACSGSTVSGARIDAPPPSLTAPCRDPLRLPARDATQEDVERWWRSDRANLLACGDKHSGLVAWIEGLLAAMQSENSRAGPERSD